MIPFVTALWVTATAFCCPPHCGATASGVQVAHGHIAADTRVLPFGTQVTLDSFPGRVFVVTDTGSAIRGNRIDIFMSCADARQWGVRQERVTVLGRVSVQPVAREVVEQVVYYDPAAGTWIENTRYRDPFTGREWDEWVPVARPAH